MITFQTVVINGKQVGEIANGVYISHRKYSKHFFKKYSGYAISEAILKYLEAINCNIICIIDDELHKTFFATPNDFKEHGKVIPYSMGKTDNQVCLGINYFKMKRWNREG